MNTDQTYHTTAVVQQRREGAAAVNAAMNPTPAGKLTDEQLANAAAESCLKYMTAETRIECDYAAESFAKHQPARAAFARAVREAVEAKQAEEITSLLKDKADAIAMAQAAERETSRGQDMRSKDREEIARLTAELDQANERVEAKQEAYERCACLLEEERLKNIKANAELERLRQSLAALSNKWRVNWTTHTVYTSFQCAQQLDDTLKPAPTAEEAEFEKAYHAEYPNHIAEAFEKSKDGRYLQTFMQATFDGWKLARAAKEGEK